MKRADLPTLAVCAAVDRYGMGAFDALAAAYPWKVVLAAVHRDVARGYLSYGVSPMRPFLAARGRALLGQRSARGAQPPW